MNDTLMLARLFAAHFGEEARSVAPLRGDGSDRRIYRIQGDTRTVVGIAGSNIGENDAFLGFSRAFRAAGLPVPGIHTVSADRSCYLEEDLGDETLYAWLCARRAEAAERGDADAAFPAAAEAMYARVLADLVRFQIDCAERVDYGLCYQTAEFCAEAMHFDLRYFRDMFLARFRPDLVDEAAFARDADTLVAELLRADRRFFLYRDFQSRNVMITGGEPRYIDYQSGRRGALQYDAAAMLFDAKACIPQQARDRLYAGWRSEVASRISPDPDFDILYWPYALVRVLQALGAFGNLGARQGKPGFLSAIPPALGNLRILCERADVLARMPYLRDVLPALADDASLASITEKD